MLIYQRVCLKISTHRLSMFETRGSPLNWPKKYGGETNPPSLFGDKRRSYCWIIKPIVSNQTMPFYCCFGMVWSPPNHGWLRWKSPGASLRAAARLVSSWLLRIQLVGTTCRVGKRWEGDESWTIRVEDVGFLKSEMGCECKKWRMGLKSQFHSRFDPSLMRQVNVAQNRTPGPQGEGRGREACRATQSLFPFTSSKPNSNRIPRPVSDLGHFTHGMPWVFKQNGILDVHPQKFMETHIQLTPRLCFT